MPGPPDRTGGAPHETHHRDRSTSTRDLALLHAWVTHPRSVFWGMQDATLEEVRDGVRRGSPHDPHHEACLGRADGEPAFLIERYDPRHARSPACPSCAPGDVGMHVLVAPTDDPGPRLHLAR